MSFVGVPKLLMGLDSRFCAGVEECLHTAMLKALDHSYIVTQRYTICKKDWGRTTKNKSDDWKRFEGSVSDTKQEIGSLMKVDD
jgi:hypothetical protein